MPQTVILELASFGTRPTLVKLKGWPHFNLNFNTITMQVMYSDSYITVLTFWRLLRASCVSLSLLTRMERVLDTVPAQSLVS